MLPSETERNENDFVFRLVDIDCNDFGQVSGISLH